MLWGKIQWLCMERSMLWGKIQWLCMERSLLCGKIQWLCSACVFPAGDHHRLHLPGFFHTFMPGRITFS